jgi:cellobiose phosphorylase
MENQPQGWQFIDDEGTFQLPNPHQISYLYFPLVNEAGMMSAITPTLNGDIKIGQNAFLTLPVSVEDLHNSRTARNFWVNVRKWGAWSVAGNSATQIVRQFDADNPEEVVLEAGFFWHKLTRKNRELGLQAETVNFVPAADDQIELMKVTLTNVSDAPLTMTPTVAIPIYGRSADDLRDHRHVTSLLHHIRCVENGVLVTPTLTFDERGHQQNSLTYAVLGATENGTVPDGFFPLVEDFIGEGGTLDWPEAVVKAVPPKAEAGQSFDGYEAIGGLCFPEITLKAGESQSYVFILGIWEGSDQTQRWVETYGNGRSFDTWLSRTKEYWKSKLATFAVQTGDLRFDLWIRWVSIQPTLRRLFGNSFLPYHDYGRGGRGWRDLWQDILALLLTESGDVSEMLFANFAGVRFDGSNATIIGSAPGEFKADRNNIPRVWMDHGSWPLLTTRLYIDQTGDLDFLLRQQSYFKDHLIHRSQQVDPAWIPERGTKQLTSVGKEYRGTILEHLLIQHLTAFFNIGEHNNIRIEGADWNDAMDMASQRGESVAFTALYAGNLKLLSELVLCLKERGVEEVEVATELTLLLDTISDPVNYKSVRGKQDRLLAYYESCRHAVNGKKTTVAIELLAKDLAIKANWLSEHIRDNEWIRSKEGYGWFNGYYDNAGKRVEGDHPSGVRMTLTGQVFPLMSGIASEEQALEIVRAADHYLYDSSVGGYRLNTDFDEVKLDLGRAFGFAFGHKENGAMFSHMAVMYANALYQRGLVRAGYNVLEGIYQHSQDFPISRIYPGIPEYFNPRGRGMYTYLTGSASWYLLTMVTEVYGVRGILGDLALEPKLIFDQFDKKGNATITTLFADKFVEVTYQNSGKLDYGEYQIASITIDGKPVLHSIREGKAMIARKLIQENPATTVKVTVQLSA